MSRLSLVLVFGITTQVGAQTPACAPLQDDRILAKDLAAVIPQFQQIPSETQLANTPPPGSQHIFHQPELQSLAQRYSLQFDVNAAVCFERAMQPLDRKAVVDAMKAALQIPDAHIELAETSLYPVPVGKIEFVLGKLGNPASADQKAPVLWRGDVLYGDGHRFAIWARVRILAHSDQITAIENLKPGRVIDASQLRVTSIEGFPLMQSERLTIDQVAGMTPLRPIPAGSVLRPDLLSIPNDVSRGDLIEIEVRSGAARLLLTARAESGGHGGDTISVRNLESNKIFAAQVAGKGKAVVRADSVRDE